MYDKHVRKEFIQHVTNSDDIDNNNSIELLDYINGKYVKLIKTEKETFYVLSSGLKHGTYIKIWSNGHKHYQFRYNEGKLEGRCCSFNKEGLCVKCEIYKDDIRIK